MILIEAFKIWSKSTVTCRTLTTQILTLSWNRANPKVQGSFNTHYSNSLPLTSIVNTLVRQLATSTLLTKTTSL